MKMKDFSASKYTADELDAVSKFLAVLDKKRDTTDEESPIRKHKAKRLSLVLDSVTDWAKRHSYDASDALFVRHLVLQTLTAIEKAEYEEAKWANGGLIPIRSEVNEGADEYGWYEMGVVTEGAKLLANDADDLPLVDLRGGYNTGRVHTWGAAFQYTTQDIRKARLQGLFDLVSEKSNATREAMDYKLNSMLAFGDKEALLHGIFNPPDGYVSKASSGSWDTTPANALGDLRTAFLRMTEGTAKKEIPDTCLMPYDIFVVLQTTERNASAGDMSHLEYLKQAFPQIRRWDWTDENDTGGEGDTPCALLYRNDASRVRAEVPLQPSPLPVEQKGRKFRTEMEGRYGGLVIRRPRSILRLDEIHS